jgi:peptide/nickel transport system substrate-binding protein
VTARGAKPGLWRRLVLGGVGLSFLAAGCTSTGPTVAKVTYVGVAGGTISFGMTESPSGCNPHTLVGDSPTTRMVLNAVLPSPYVINSNDVPTANPEVILESEVVSIKPETIVYTLNPKAVWSDGTPITAADFAYAWQQQRGDPTTDSRTVASIAGYRDIKSVTGTNHGRTVTVVFHTPFADWKMLFAELLPAHVMEKAGWDPSCTTVDPAVDLSGGPFMLGSVSAQTIVLKDNPSWWGIKPNARKISIHIASSSTQLAQWIRSGYVQVALPNGVTPTFLNEVTSLPNAQSSVSLSNTQLQLELSSGPNTTLSPDMRFAISLSVDRQALVTDQADWALPNVQVADSHIYVQGESGYKASQAVSAASSSTAPPPPSSTSTTVINQGGTLNFPVTTSPQEAAALMLASGYNRDGTGTYHSAFGAPLTLHLVVDEDDPWAKATAPQLEAQLEHAGFVLSVYPAASAEQAGEVMADGFADLALLPRTISPFLSQTLAWYSPLLGPPGQNGSKDWTGYDNPSFNGLITAASQQLSVSAAATDYQQADLQLWSDLVALPLFNEPGTLIWNRDIAEVTTTPTNDNLLWYAQYWAVKVPQSTSDTTPPLPAP